jgi:hypothetical protein
MAADAPDHFATRGKISEIRGDLAVFNPAGTNYELHLKLSAAGAASLSNQLNTPVQVLIRASGRKVWTVPTGGNFITPITGTPRIVQGWVLYADSNTLVVQAGANILVSLPAADSAVDLTEGPVAVGQRVNCTLLPGASIELATTSAPAASAAAGAAVTS